MVEPPLQENQIGPALEDTRNYVEDVLQVAKHTPPPNQEEVVERNNRERLQKNTRSKLLKPYVPAIEKDSKH